MGKVVYPLFVLIVLFLMNKLRGISDPELHNIRERYYMKITMVLLVLISALRGNAVGTDTISYIYDYNFVARNTFAQCAARFSIGSGYFLLMKVFSLSGLGVHWWFGLVTAFYCYTLYIFLERFSEDKLFGVLCFLCTGLYVFTLAAGKQCLGMGFGMLSFLCFTDKKYLRAVIFALVAFWCHHVVAIFLLAIFLWMLKEKSYYPMVIIAFIFMCIFAKDTLWFWFITSLDDDHFTSLYLLADNKYSSTTFIYYAALVICSLLTARNFVRKDRSTARLLYGGALIAVALQSMATSYSTAFRVAFIFVPFLCALMGSCFSEKETKILKYVVMAMIMFYFFYVTPAYSFFWQNS